MMKFRKMIEATIDWSIRVYMTKGPSLLVSAVIAVGVMFLASDAVKSWCGQVV